MKESTPRWPLGSGKRIAHALACVVGFELWQLLAFAFVFGVLRIAPADMWAGDPAVIINTIISGSLAMVCAVWLCIVRLGRVSFRDLGWHAERLGLSLGWGILGALLLCATVIGVLAASGALSQTDVIGFIGGYTVRQRLLFLAVGASAAAVEESLFRGYLQPALAAKIGLVGGILVGAAVFSLYHLFMGPSLVNLCGKFAIGVILGSLRGRDRSLVAPILAHFAMWQIFGSL